MKTSLKSLSLLLFSIICIVQGCSVTEQEKVVEGKVILLDTINAPFVDSHIDSVINIYRSDLEEEMNQEIALSAVAMEKGTPQGLLNNFVADLVFEKSRQLYKAEDNKPIDFCLLNYGGLRTSLPQGPVTRSRVFELMPFENEMIVITLSPEKTWELFEYLAAANVGMPVSGITLGIKDNTVSDIKIQGEAFDPGKNYKVVTSDYLAGGGDNMNFFLDPVSEEYLGMKIRDAIMLHLEKETREGKMITSELDNRIYIID